MNKDLVWIKKHYNEKFAHLCRELFPTLLETEGLLPKLIDSHFDHSKFLYDDIVDNNQVYNFKNYIYSLVDVENDNEMVEEKSPKELLESVGYELYECKREEDIQSFKKYYAPGEELCTFRGGRLDSCYVFFAVKKDVDKIKREDFKEPKRQDEYGTSVISIQFSKGKNNIVSIKNRYNHKVNHPDATFNNNLDNIVYGLSDSFAREYKLEFLDSGKTGFELPDYVQCDNGKYYRYNYEIDNIYYCANNAIVENFDSRISGRLSNNYLLVDHFMINLKEKTITSRVEDDSFIDSITDCGTIEKIKYHKDKDDGMTIELYIEKKKEPIVIRIDKYGRITGYVNNIVKKIGDGFLSLNTELSSIEMNNVVRIGESFLYNNAKLRKISFPKLLKVEGNFLCENVIIGEINLPLLKEVGNCFLVKNKQLKVIELPNIRKIGSSFISHNASTIKKVNLPRVKKIGNSFLAENENIDEVNMPSLISVGNGFLHSNRELKSLELPSIEEIGSYFLYRNTCLKELLLSKVRKIGENFLCLNKELTKIDFPCLESVGNYFIRDNVTIEEASLPNLKIINEDFLERNGSLRRLELPSVVDISDGFMLWNSSLEEISLPKVRIIGNFFLGLGRHLSINRMDFPNLIAVGCDFMPNAPNLEEVSMPNIDSIGIAFLVGTRGLKKVNIPLKFNIMDRFILLISDSYTYGEAQKILREGSKRKKLTLF